MLGCYKKTREEIVKVIRKSPSTEDGFQVCPKFRELNNTIGEKLDKKYIYDRDYFVNKICFNQADIEAYLEQRFNCYDIEIMQKRDNFLYDIIKDDIDRYKLDEKVEGQEFTLGELIDTSIYIFNAKH